MARWTFDIQTSSLIRLALSENRFDVWEFFDAGAYPRHRDQKDEVEAMVTSLVDASTPAELEELLQTHLELLRTWVPDRLRAERSHADQARLVAFAELQWSIDDAVNKLELRALDAPRPDDWMFMQHDGLYDALDRDGLFRIRAENIPSTDTGSLQVFCLGEDAIFPHRALEGQRELVQALARLALKPRLDVRIALDPYRAGPLAEVPKWLLQDYWSGIKLSQENLDSLDAHDVGVAAFHAATNRSMAADLFFPLLGTWFDWQRRGDDDNDPVKRLYIREVRPADNGRGADLVAVRNRELHAERDTSSKSFSHVDGKIRRYPTETYGPRRDDPRATYGPPSHSRKLWRVDGRMTDEEWCHLVGLFFRQNELIEEYFSEAFPD